LHDAGPELCGGVIYKTAGACARYRRNASCQSGMWTLYACRLLGDRTEYAGRFAGRGNSAVVTGLTLVGSPDSRTISVANSYQVQLPELVTCTMPLAPARQS